VTDPRKVSRCGECVWRSSLGANVNLILRLCVGDASARNDAKSRRDRDESLASTVESGNHKEKQKDELPPVTVTFTRFVRRGSARACTRQTFHRDRFKELIRIAWARAMRAYTRIRAGFAPIRTTGYESRSVRIMCPYYESPPPMRPPDSHHPRRRARARAQARASPGDAFEGGKGYGRDKAASVSIRRRFKGTR